MSIENDIYIDIQMQFNKSNITMTDYNKIFPRVQLKYGLRRWEGPVIMVGSIYLSTGCREPPPRPKVKEPLHKARNRLDLLLGCDATYHHVSWQSTHIKKRGKSLHDFIMSEGLLLLNSGDEPIFMDPRTQEVSDITICKAGLVD